MDIIQPVAIATGIKRRKGALEMKLLRYGLILFVGSALVLSITSCTKKEEAPKEPPKKSLGILDKETKQELKDAVEATSDALGKAAGEVISNVAEELQAASDQLEKNSGKWSEQVANRTRQAAEDIADYAEDLGEELAKEKDTAVNTAAQHLRETANRAETALEQLKDQAPEKIDEALSARTGELDEVVVALEKASEAWAQKLSGEVVVDMDAASAKLKDLADWLEQQAKENTDPSESE